MDQRPDLAPMMASVAKALLGEPNRKLTRPTELRFGSKGSLSIDLIKGTFYDYEAEKGGGVIDLIRREQKCSVGAALKFLENIGEYVAPVQDVKTSQSASASYQDFARKIWRETVSAENTLAERYLQSRSIGLGLECVDIRFHPRCPFGKDDIGANRYVPAMVAAVRNPFDRTIVGIHRTELTSDARKADRKMLGPCHDGVVMLNRHDLDGPLGLCEGIETGLAVAKMGGSPVWACLSAGSMASMQPMGGVSHLTVFADHDEAGISAANRVSRAWLANGISTTINKPKIRGHDFADTLIFHEKRGVA